MRAFGFIGTTADTDQMLHKTNFSGAVGLVIGSEGKGLSQSTEKKLRPACSDSSSG